MIIEQAFFAVPEFLVGTGFVRYETEGTLVMAYAMAILQELNGRNVNNPISLVNAETKYPTTNRAADLHVALGSMGTYNAKLSAFGVRQECWIEAKFFRKSTVSGKPTLDATTAGFALLRDLVRLSVFPSETVDQASKSARYILHAYEGAVDDHLAFERNSGGGRTARNWLKNLHAAGAQQIRIDDLQDEPAAFDSEVGEPLRRMDLSLDVTTFVLGDGGSPYNVYLSRIDGFRFNLAGTTVSLAARGLTEEAAGDWTSAVKSVDNALAK